MTDTVHATCVAIDERGVLIEGASGAGKSDLALRLIDRGAMLVADDRVALANEAGALVARCPGRLAGLIEVRGLGIVPLPHRESVRVVLVIALGATVERMPERATRTLHGVALPLVALDAREASAPIKVERALAWLA